ncbi:seryl-tRNA synthetase [Choiromyces venosus 120613-1]|uniref:serine--tRNA ligase n=1 Tax=Choiromyces venosus 120613-1 TaxID=1336337 RepID=A0A3N4JQT8_9PEZI|nr:seryl-tRNA synthetase [Choiromyces venosus 120613-1]
MTRNLSRYRPGVPSIAWVCSNCRLRPIRGTRHFSIKPDLQPPPTAPKPTINVKSIREFPEYYRQNCLNRNYPSLADAPERIIALHGEWMGLQKGLRGDRERQNTLSAQLRSRNPLMQDPHGGGDKAEVAVGGQEKKEGLLAEAKEIKAKISGVEEKEKVLENEMKNLAIQLPNWTHKESPVGTEPKLLGYINPELAPPAQGTGPRISHTQIGSELGLLDFSAAGTVSGWGWYYLLNEAVLLEQALINYALSFAMKKGWKLVTPPNIVYSHMAAACGFRPRDQHGEQQIYTLDGPEGKIQHCLAGTAEIPLAGLYANKTFTEDQLPVKVVGVGRAYRAEAGARGVESKGLFRVHEFTKVELFAWGPPGQEDFSTPTAHSEPTSTTTNTTPEEIPPVMKHANKTTTSASLFGEMLELQKSIISSLGLHARILEMPTTDLGASASRKIDIEAYVPSREAKDPWGEISSLSNCTDYQSRRLNTRVKMAKPGAPGGVKSEFPWTLNGTAMAVPRVLVAVLENGWSEERGGVVVPEVLREYMGGLEFIGRKK